MSGNDFSLESVTRTINAGWNAVTEAITGAAQTLQEETLKAATFAEAVLTKTTLTESEGVYTLDGPFASKFTFSWRELIMIGGIVSSVIFATAAFFTGSSLTGIIYLSYTVLLIFGSYWLSEWTKNLTAEQIFENARAGGVAAINILREIVTQFTNVLEGHGQVYATQLAELQQLNTHLDTTSTHLDTTSTHLDTTSTHLDTTSTHLDEGVQSMGKTNELFSAEVRALPQRLAPFIEQMGETLRESRDLRDEFRQQNVTYQNQNAHLREQIAGNRAEVAELRNQITALRSVLTDFEQERQKLHCTGEDFVQERKRLTDALDRVLPPVPVTRTTGRGNGSVLTRQQPTIKVPAG